MDTCWFSADELHEIRLREARLVGTYRHHDDYYQEQSMGLLSAAASNANSLTQTQAQQAMFVAGNAARGLESQIIPCIRQRKKQALQAFFKSQHALQQWRGYDPNTRVVCQLTPELQRQALSDHYHKLAAPAVRLAQLLAQGDAIAISGLTTTTTKGCEMHNEAREMDSEEREPWFRQTNTTQNYTSKCFLFELWKLDRQDLVLLYYE